MNITKEIMVEESLRDFVESLDYEYSSRRDAIAFMLSNDMNITTNSFKQYQKEMTEYNVKFNEAKKQIEENYVLPIAGEHKVNWIFDYATAKLTITFID